MNQLLDLVVEAHGGLERWRAIARLDVSLSFSGSFLRMKGYPEGLPDITARIKMRQPVVSIRPYMRVDGCGQFTPDRVWIDDDKGHVLNQRIEPRASFAGHALETPWDQLQLLYFVSYGLWNYFNTPFFLIQPGFEVREIEPHEENGEIWRRLHVRFPGEVPAHCREQIFFFNQKGLLQRVDYAPDVVAASPASHYCFDHETFSGLVFPTLRRVVQRTSAGPELSGPTAILLQIADVAVVA